MRQVWPPSPRLRGEGRGEGRTSLGESWSRCEARIRSAVSGRDRCGAPSRLQNSHCGHVFAVGNSAASNSSAKSRSIDTTLTSFAASAA